MSARVDLDQNAGASSLPSASVAPPPPALLTLDPDAEVGNYLPSDHPAWMRDALSLSQRARALLAQLKPVVVKVVAFWEHRARSIVVGGRTLSVDASGSYHLE